MLGNTLATYTGEGRLLSRRRGGQSYFYLLDALGTPIGMMRADVVIVTRYRVDSWGNPVATVGDVTNIFGFTGYPIDNETGQAPRTASNVTDMFREQPASSTGTAGGLAAAMGKAHPIAFWTGQSWGVLLGTGFDYNPRT